MKIGIVGYGYVGKAVYQFFNGHKSISEIRVYDPMLNMDSQEDVNKMDIAFVCVPTESLISGRCNISLVKSSVEWLTTETIVIKSTVEPGTTEKLTKETGKNLVFAPEFIGESTYDTGPYNFHNDMKKHGFFIFGGPKETTSRLVDTFQRIAGPSKQYIQTDATTAEMSKYTINSFLATKLTFCYEFERICKALGADYNEVRELWLLDPRISPSHTSVFHDQRFPFDGKCLPKDLNALVCKSEFDLGYKPDFLNEVLDSCDRIGKIREPHGLLDLVQLGLSDYMLADKSVRPIDENGNPVGKDKGEIGIVEMTDSTMDTLYGINRYCKRRDTSWVDKVVADYHKRIQKKEN